MRASRRSPIARPSRRGRMRWTDAFTLVAVGLVVLLVSLPRLRDFALRENEGDARALVLRLAQLAERDASGGLNVEQIVSTDPTLARQLDDVEFLEQGRLLRRHGYLFEVLAGEESERACARVRAWPWKHRRTGYAAFAWTREHALVGDSNSGGTWSGLGAPPTVDRASWRTLAAR
jgi:hypothetical protein